VVYRLARRLCGDAHEAEDLVQETFLRAHRAYERFELRDYGAKPWLLKILHHVFFTRRTRAAKGPALLADAEFVEAQVEQPVEVISLAGNGEVDWDHFDDELKSALDRLPAEYRSVMMLWALGDLTYKEISDVLDCPIGTVMSRLYRARNTLARTLADFAAERGVTQRNEA
jgi:RNA polymerase sigma-70 factor (ECF subfamily)